MKINWLILLCVALIQPFMLHSAETAGISAANSKTLITITQSPLNKEQITALAQQAVANCITSQTQKYAKTLQKKLATLLTFRSKAQPANLRSQNAKLILNRQSLHHGYIQADQYDDTDASPSISTKQSWNSLFRNKLLVESSNEQAEISWARKTASLLVQYWPIYTAYKFQKNRELIARKREQTYDSVEKIQEPLRRNRRHNDSPVHFVPVADEQTPASTAFDLLMHSNHDVVDFACLPDTDDNLLCFDLPTPTIETCDFSWIGEHNEN